jgi:antitoxin component of RelBE/YafQ-DinJ toxin-antitoxin module
MASTVTTPVAARIPNELVEPFRSQARRFGLTPSQAIATLVAGALAVEPTPAAPPIDPLQSAERP